jgi:hypothetical protein
MTLAQLLVSLSEAERDYIANRDYGNDAPRHRKELDAVIARDGAIDMASQYWFPYEVIELCRNHLEAGHEREFAACAGIVLKNILDGTDKSNDPEMMIDLIGPEMLRLPTELRTLLIALFDEVTEKT